LTPRKFFKIDTIQEITKFNNLTLEFVKVKGHSDDFFDQFIQEIESENLLKSRYNSIKYYPRWNNIPI
jgi:hypothetical protein